MKDRILQSQRPGQPGRTEAHIWIWDLLVNEQAIAELERTLSNDEWQRVRGFRFHGDARRFIARRGVLRQILGAYLGLPPHEVQFAYGSQGKPSLAAALFSPLQFNLSDSGELAALALATGHPIGIDIERLRPLPDAEALATHLFAAQEVEQLNRTAATERARIFFHIWTRKEAVAKADGDGLRSPLHGFAIDAARRPRLTPPDEWHLHRLALPAGFVGTLATRKEIKKIIYCSPARIASEFSLQLDRG